MKTFFFILIIVFVHACANAQVADSTVSTLDPVAVTASLAPQKVSVTGRNILVIPGERFAQLPVSSIDELLRFLPGIEVQMRGPAGSQSDIVMRGGTFQQVLVVIDGVRLNDANTGHFSSYIPIAPSEIERIEILKGASSAIYGSDAVGGVIHIITHAFSLKTATTKKAEIKAAAGSYSLFNVNAGVQLSDPRSTLTAGIVSNNSTGQPQRGTHGYFHNHTASLSYGRHLGDRWHLALRSTWDKRDFSAQNFYTTFTSDTASETVRTNWSQVQVTHNTTTNQLQADIGYKFLEDEFTFSPAGLPNRSKSNLLQALLTDVWTIGGRSSLTTGLQFVNKRIRSNDRGEHNLDNAGLFAQWNQQVGQKILIAPGLRLDWNERSGLELIPQMNISYRSGNIQLRGSAGKTIRDADFTERFNNYGRPTVASGRIGNPALNPERSFSYELGADFFAHSSLRISTGFFQRLHSDLVDYVVTPYADMPRKENLVPGGVYSLAKNISEVRTTGVETDVYFSRTLSTRQSIWATTGIVWLESKSDAQTPSLYISSHAKWLINFNLRYSFEPVSISINGLYKKRARQVAAAPVIAPVSSDYFLLNARVEAGIIRQRLWMYVEADNLLDRTYTDVLGAPMPGIWFMAGVRFIYQK